MRHRGDRRHGRKRARAAAGVGRSGSLCDRWRNGHAGRTAAGPGSAGPAAGERIGRPAARSGSSGARSARRSWAAASTTSPSTRATPRPSTSATRPAASGRPSTTAPRGRRSSTSYPVSSIGDIALAPSNPNIIYVGTGEPNNRQSSSFGAGVYKSTDGGKKFEYVGLKETQTIAQGGRPPEGSRTSSTSRRSATCSDRTRSAALYKTTDGGKTWTNTKFIDNDTGFTDVVMHPTEPEHAVRRVVSAPPAAVGLQRRRPGQRHLEDDRRRQDLDAADGQRPARPTRSSAASASTSRARSRPTIYASDRSRAERRHRRGRQRRRHARAARPGPRRWWRRRRPRRRGARRPIRRKSGIWRSDDGGKTWKFL